MLRKLSLPEQELEFRRVLKAITEVKGLKSLGAEAAPLFRKCYKHCHCYHRAGPDDWVLGGIRTTLVTDIYRINKTEPQGGSWFTTSDTVSEDDLSLEKLFTGFLHYYQRVDFAATGFSLTRVSRDGC